MLSKCRHFRPEKITYSESVRPGGAELAIYFSKNSKKISLILAKRKFERTEIEPTAL
jgi:hypothetical protein